MVVDCLRPTVEEDELPNEEKQASLLMQLIETCWNEDPKCRPEFKYCLSELGKISPHRGELMDNLIELMEQYTTSLESIVAERTADIIVEKEKGDLLLSKMLPPLIAEELKLGKNPQPEYFASVTIYFRYLSIAFVLISRSYSSIFKLHKIGGGNWELRVGELDRPYN